MAFQLAQRTRIVMLMMPVGPESGSGNVLRRFRERAAAEFLPQEPGFGSGMTCWRRLRDWHQAGVWQRLHGALLAELNAAGALDWSRAVIDSSHVRALKGGPKRGRARSTAPSRARSTM